MKGKALIAFVIGFGFVLASCAGPAASPTPVPAVEGTSPPAGVPPTEPAAPASATVPPSMSEEEIIQAAMDRLAQPSTDADKELALKCWRDSVCTTGRGTLTVALADGFGENPWRQTTHMLFILQALKFAEVNKIVITDAGGDSSKEIANIQTLIAQGVDVIITFPLTGESLVPTLQRAIEAGIVVVPYHCNPCTDKDLTAVVLEDLCKFGTQQAEITIRELNNEGNAVFLGGTPGNPASEEIQRCANEEFQASNIQILGTADTNWTAEGAFKEMSAFLARFPEIDAVLTDYTNAARGVVRAYEEAGKSIPIMFGIGDDNGIFRMWEELHDTNPNFKIFYTNADTKVVPIAFEAAMQARLGKSIPTLLWFSVDLVELVPGVYEAELPDDFQLTTGLPVDIGMSMFESQ